MSRPKIKYKHGNSVDWIMSGGDAPMHLDNVYELVACALLNRRVRAEAVRLVKPHHFSRLTETGLRLLWGCVVALHGDYPGKDRIPLDTLLAAVKDAGMAAGAEVTDEQFTEIVDLPEDIDLTDPNQEPGFLWRTYDRPQGPCLDVDAVLKQLKKFLQERAVSETLVRAASDAQAGGYVIPDMRGLLDNTIRTEAQIAAIGREEASMADGLDDFIGQLGAGWGRLRLGMRTGLEPLDEMLDGLRDLNLLAGASSTGKTVLATQLAVGVAQDDDNDAAVAFISLDMGVSEIKARVFGHVANLPHRVITKGSPELLGGQHDTYFNEADAASFEAARETLAGATGRRLFLFGADDLGGEVTAARLRGLLDRVKAKSGASRALLVIDYLQLVAAADADGDDLAADKARIELVREALKMPSDTPPHLCDAALVVSETRKRIAGAQQGPATSDDVLGSGRTVYRADCVMLLNTMTQPELKRAYGLGATTGTDAADYRATLVADGISPMTLDVTKARDGRERGAVALEFLYRLGGMIPVDTPVGDAAVAVAAAVAAKTVERRARVLAAVAALTPPQPTAGVTLNSVQEQLAEMSPAGKMPNKTTLKGDLTALVAAGTVEALEVMFKGKPAVRYRATAAAAPVEAVEAVGA
jgi:hypothetical protein